MISLPLSIDIKSHIIDANTSIAYALVSPSKDSDADGDTASRMTDFDSLAVPLASSGSAAMSHEK